MSSAQKPKLADRLRAALRLRATRTARNKATPSGTLASSAFTKCATLPKWANPNLHMDMFADSGTL